MLNFTYLRRVFMKKMVVVMAMFVGLGLFGVISASADVISDIATTVYAQGDGSYSVHAKVPRTLVVRWEQANMPQANWETHSYRDYTEGQTTLIDTVTTDADRAAVAESCHYTVTTTYSYPDLIPTYSFTECYLVMGFTYTPVQ
jgi:hypothetical protein